MNFQEEYLNTFLLGSFCSNEHPLFIQEQKLISSQLVVYQNEGHP